MGLKTRVSIMKRSSHFKVKFRFLCGTSKCKLQNVCGACKAEVKLNYKKVWVS